MEKNLNFRSLALFFAVIFAVSPLTAAEASFFARNKKAIIIGTAITITAAASIYYFRNDLWTIASKLLKTEKAKNEAGTGRSIESLTEYQDGYDKAYGNKAPEVKVEVSATPVTPVVVVSNEAAPVTAGTPEVSAPTAPVITTTPNAGAPVEAAK